MTIKATVVGVFCAALLGTPLLAEPDLRLIVHRMTDSVEIYAAIVASDLPTILQADPSGLAAEDGRVYFGELRQFGTFDFPNWGAFGQSDVMVAKINAHTGAGEFVVKTGGQGNDGVAG